MAALLLLAASPVSVHAAVCNIDGQTVIYINGIFTEEDKAKADKKEIEKTFAKEVKNQKLVSTTVFELGYNATHLGGVGDILKSVLQKMWEVEGETKEDFDLEHIVKQIQPQVTTQKILILGHSQGTFYANALYDYLIRRGVSAKSVAVLNLATPASFVSGHGKYLTNTNDLLVQNVRTATALTTHPDPLPANLDIPPVPGDEGLFAGHSLSGVYLKERPTNIAAAIASALSKLESDPMRDVSQPCIPSPTTNVVYVSKALAFGALDAASRAKNIVSEYNTPLMPITAPMYLANALSGFLGAVSGGATAPSTPPTIPAVSNDESIGQSPQSKSSPSPVVVQGDVTTPTSQPVLVDPPVVPPQDLLASPRVPQQTSPAPLFVSPPEPVRGFGGLTSLVPGFGAGASSGGTASPISVPVEETQAPPAETIVTPPSTPTVTEVPLTITSPSRDVLVATTSMLVVGSTEAGREVVVTYGGHQATTTASTTGAWEVLLVLEEGRTTVTATVTTQGSETATPVARAITVDTIAPAVPRIYVQECEQSLVSGACILATTTITVETEAGDDAYVVHLSVGSATTTDTVAQFVVADRATTTILAIAEDEAGNRSTTSTTEVYVFTQPLLITEVAWAGTTALASDEWVEITNVSPFTIDVSRAQLKTADGVLNYALTGTLAPYGAQTLADAYLIESRSSATSEAHSQLEATLSLADTGDQLVLMYDGEVSDSTPAVSVCGGWCGGALKQVIRYSDTQGPQQGTRTMERIMSAQNGGRRESWQTNDAYVYGTPPSDASGNPVLGTPRRDTREWFTDAEWVCASRMQDGVPYVPGTGVCTYYSGFIHTNARRYGTLFKGVVGSSTVISNHSLNRAMISVQNGDDVIGAVSGDTFFVALYETRNGPSFSNDMQRFHDYFTGVSPTPPHSNYRVIPWSYGTTP